MSKKAKSRGDLNARQAAQLRTEINQLARELDKAKTRAEIRNLKQQIKVREIRLSEG